MSERLKSGMREILTESRAGSGQEAEQLIGAFTAALKAANGNQQSGVVVNQNIYADETSYVGQQREAARQFRQIARTL